MDPGLSRSVDDIVYGILSNRSAISRIGYHRRSAYFQVFAIQTFFQLFQKGKVLRLRHIRHTQALRGRDHTTIVRREGLQDSEVECGEGFIVSIYDFKLRSVGMGDYGHVGQAG